MMILVLLKEPLTSRSSAMKSNRHSWQWGHHIAPKVWYESFVVVTFASHTILVIIVMLLLK